MERTLCIIKPDATKRNLTETINNIIVQNGLKIIAQKNIHISFKILGIPDEYMVNGSQSDVLDHYEMHPEKISDIAKIMLK